MSVQHSAPSPYIASPSLPDSPPAPSVANIDALILSRLDWHARGKGRCWPGDATLARDLGLTVAQVSESILRLWDNGVIGIEYQGQRRFLLLAQSTQVAQGNKPFKKKESKKKNTQNLVLCSSSSSQSCYQAYFADLESDLRDYHRARQMAPPAPIPPVEHHQPPADTAPLVADLASRGVSPIVAKRLVRDHTPDRIRRQVVAFDGAARKGPGWLVSAIEEDYQHPVAKGPKSRPPAPAGLTPEQIAKRQGTAHRVAREHWWAAQSPEEQAAITLEAEARARGRDLDPTNRAFPGLVIAERWAVVESRMMASRL